MVNGYLLQKTNVQLQAQLVELRKPYPPFKPSPHLIVSPQRGELGTLVTIEGSGFAVAYNVTITIGGLFWRQVVSNPSGSFTFRAYVDLGALEAGSQEIKATDDKGNSATTTFWVGLLKPPQPPQHYTKSIDGVDYLVYYTPGSKVLLLCQQPCPMSSQLMTSLYSGLKKSIDELVQIAGIDFPRGPIEAHFTDDSICGNLSDFSTGSAFNTISPEGKGTLCLFFYGRTVRGIPFDENNVSRVAAHQLSVHEAVHQLFVDTTVDYWTQEYFCVMLSFYISGYYIGGDVTDDSSFEFGISPCDQRIEPYVKLPYQLCKLYGIDVDSYDSIFRQMDAKRKQGITISTRTFKEIIDDVAGQDTSQAFINAELDF
jgi:3D (Asp-Asp-Asp) domain-containing protein